MLSARIQDSEVTDLEIRRTLESKRGAPTQGPPWRLHLSPGSLWHMLEHSPSRAGSLRYFISRSVRCKNFIAKCDWEDSGPDFWSWNHHGLFSHDKLVRGCRENLVWKPSTEWWHWTRENGLVSEANSYSCLNTYLGLPLIPITLASCPSLLLKQPPNGLLEPVSFVSNPFYSQPLDCKWGSDIWNHLFPIFYPKERPLVIDRMD